MTDPIQKQTILIVDDEPVNIKILVELKRNRDFLEWMLKERTLQMQEMEKEYMYLYLRK